MTPSAPDSTPAINKLVAETEALYSLPAVALEVLRLTGTKAVDVPALKEAIERDPGLVAKLLKVVNSSLFGLSGEVTNLSQALALLGVEPLKMLVLGFSLPDRLLAEASAEQLDHYWRTALTRALVARDLANDRFDVHGDDAFIAALLLDVGVLVLLGQLGATYAKLLAEAAEERADVTKLERAALGFDRTQLSVAFVRHWRLPSAIATAIDSLPQGEEPNALVRGDAPPLARPLHLADLIARLVVDRRLDVLPELVESGEAYCELTNKSLHTLIEPLEERVAHLAEAMATTLTSEADYLQTLTDAHAQLSLVTESVVAAHLGVELSDDELCEAMLAESHELRLAMRQFLSGGSPGMDRLLRAEGAHVPAETDDDAGLISDQERQRLLDALGRLADQGALERHSLSLALMHVNVDLDDRWHDRLLRQALAAAAPHLGEHRAARLTLGRGLVALLLPAVSRDDAVAFLQDVERRLAEPPEKESPSSREPKPITARAGVGSVEAVPNRFDPAKLIDAAEGCLSATQNSGAARVRSIEVY